MPGKRRQTRPFEKSLGMGKEENDTDYWFYDKVCLDAVADSEFARQEVQTPKVRAPTYYEKSGSESFTSSLV